MPIEHSPEADTFFLHAGNTTYAMKVLAQGYLTHLYWGPRVAIQDLDFVLQFRDRGLQPESGRFGEGIQS